MVVIRLARGGTKKRPFFHIVITNSRNARDGRFIERLGFYNPIATGGEIRLQLNQERVNYWRAKGAQPSSRVEYLLDNFAEIVSGAIDEAKKVENKKKATIKAAKEATEAKATPAESENPEAPAAQPEETAAETK